MNASGNRELKILDPKVLPAGIKELDVSDTGLTELPNLSEFKNLIKLNVSGCPIQTIELTRLPEKMTIICDGNMTLLVKGEKFTGEKWNVITIQREVSTKPIGQQYIYKTA